MFEIEGLCRPCREPRQTFGQYRPGHVPNVGKLSIEKASEELSQRNPWTWPHDDLRLWTESKCREIPVHFDLRTRARMKGLVNAGLLKQSTRLLTDLNPLLLALPITPFVQQYATESEDAGRFTKYLAPIRCEIEQPGDDNRFEGA